MILSLPRPAVQASTLKFLLAELIASRNEQSPSAFTSSSNVFTVIDAALTGCGTASTKAIDENQARRQPHHPFFLPLRLISFTRSFLLEADYHGVSVFRPYEDEGMCQV